jgi:hypothetical protein
MDMGKMLASLFGGPFEKPTEMEGGNVLPPIVNPISGEADAPAPDSAVDIVGFKPTHRNALGRIADVVLGAYGKGPVYETRMRERDAGNAMRGFVHDPLQSIAQLMTIPGQADKAAKLYDQYTDNQRMQESVTRQNNVFDMKKEELVYNRVAGIMRAADTPEKWVKARQIASMIGQKYGVDVDKIIPEKFDRDSIDFINQGQIKPIDAAKLEETKDYHGDIITTRERGQDLQHGDRQDDIAEDRRHHTVMENRPRATKPAPQSVMTKYGPGIISKDGTRMLVMRDGKKYGYVKAGKNGNNINWVPAGEVEVK